MRAWQAATGLVALLLAAASGAASAAGCAPPPQVAEATTDEIGAWLKAQRRRVLTFAGYSGAGYEDGAAMRGRAARVLARHDPARTIVNVGATEQGIGAVYALARERGFRTIGIVSTLARDEQVPLSPCVEQVFFVRDTTWGGVDAATGRLSPTSAAIVRHSHRIVGIGGGDVARDEMLAARRAGKRVDFFPADMSHAAAREKAQKKGQPEPSDFRGTAHAALVRER